MIDVSEAVQRQLDGGKLSVAVVLRINTTAGVIRLWGGVGDFLLPDNPDELIEDDLAQPYMGYGHLVGLPVVQQAINGQAQRIELMMSGAPVTPAVMQLAASEKDSIRGATVNLGVVFLLPGTQQPLSSTLWLWEGEADSLQVSHDKRGGVRSIGLSVGSVMTGRRRPPLALFTDQDQRRRSPTDAFFSEVKRYGIGATKNWPKG